MIFLIMFFFSFSLGYSGYPGGYGGPGSYYPGGYAPQPYRQPAYTPAGGYYPGTYPVAGGGKFQLRYSI